MKKSIFLTLVILLMGASAFANAIVENSEKDLLFSRCCTVTVTDVSTGDSVSATSCRTTLSEACDAAKELANFTPAPKE